MIVTFLAGCGTASVVGIVTLLLTPFFVAISSLAACAPAVIGCQFAAYGAFVVTACLYMAAVSTESVELEERRIRVGLVLGAFATLASIVTFALECAFFSCVWSEIAGRIYFVVSGILAAAALTMALHVVDKTRNAPGLPR